MVIIAVAQHHLADAGQVDLHFARVIQDSVGICACVEENFVPIRLDQRGKAPFASAFFGKICGEDGNLDRPDTALLLASLSLTCGNSESGKLPAQESISRVASLPPKTNRDGIDVSYKDAPRIPRIFTDRCNFITLSV